MKVCPKVAKQHLAVWGMRECAYTPNKNDTSSSLKLLPYAQNITGWYLTMVRSGFDSTGRWIFSFKWPYWPTTPARLPHSSLLPIWRREFSSCHVSRNTSSQTSSIRALEDYLSMPDAKLYSALNRTALDTVCRLIYTQSILVICNLLDTNDWHQHQIVFLWNVDLLLCFSITVNYNTWEKVWTFNRRWDCLSGGFVVRVWPLSL